MKTIFRGLISGSELKNRTLLILTCNYFTFSGTLHTRYFAPCLYKSFQTKRTIKSYKLLHLRVVIIIINNTIIINKMFGTRIFKMSSTVSPYRCEACGSSFNSLQELDQHKRQEHQK